ncbi:MAG: adenine phosphoribosyltransferase [Oscillospiraceae bacterium]|nr:adenine phosphoribosyltransferase [Oscillospiraceae bacterium]
MGTYGLDVAGLHRELPICKASPSLSIAAFVIFGDVELTVACARELIKLTPEFDYLVAPEAKAIPLIHEMARQSGRGGYFLARKQRKLYMDGVFETEVRSISTAAEQKLYMDVADAKKIRGKRIAIVDDVVSTGESLRAVEQLVEKAGGTVVARLAIVAEGDARRRSDVTYLAQLPLFDGAGNALK